MWLKTTDGSTAAVLPRSFHLVKKSSCSMVSARASHGAASKASTRATKRFWATSTRVGTEGSLPRSTGAKLIVRSSTTRVEA